MGRRTNHQKNAIADVETFNVTGSTRIEEHDIRKSANLPGAIYSPEISPSVDVYVNRCLFRIFPTGTVSCFGSNRDKVTKAAIELFARLHSVGVNAPQNPAISFHSEACVLRLGRKLLLGKAYYLLKGSEFSQKGPRLLSLRLDKPQVTMQLFEDGTITCLGARNRQESKQAFSRTLGIIEDNCLMA
jgi:TATA-box binding protein (TBP) (component of TFIID and TFIIIB)